MSAALRDRWAAAATMQEFVAAADANAEMWRSMSRRAVVPDDIRQRASRLTESRRLLVLLEDWCGDAVNTIPLLAALAEGTPQLELRVIGRDANRDLMATHHTGGAHAIPVVIVLDQDDRELAWWGPRPGELQLWATSPEARAMSSPSRYREIRRWYARDRGRTTLLEVVALLERTVATSSSVRRGAA